MSGTQLPQIDLEILKLLWLDLRSGRSGGLGLTRKQLFVALHHDVIVAGETPCVKTDAALRPHLRKITQRSPSVVVVRPVETNEPGGKPNGYAIDRDHIVTWPSTAAMLIALWETEPVKQVEQSVFVEQVLQRKIPNSSTGKPATENEILKQVKTSHEWGYITYVNETVMVPSSRLEYELEYLAFVARHL